MYQTFYPFLFVVLCVTGVSCIPNGTSVDTSQSVNQEVKELSDNQSNQKQDQDNRMTIHKKIKKLMLAQDYQGALDLMPLLEIELLGKTFEKGMLEKEPINENLSAIRYVYTYLHVALGRDAEALQKIREIELPVEVNPVGAVHEMIFKTTVLERLNMVDEAIDEYNLFLSNQEIVSVLKADFPLLYAEMMCSLIVAQIVEGDFKSVQNNIDKLKNYMQELPTYISEFRQIKSKYNEFIAYIEHYINNLTETHVACFIHEISEPPTRVPEYPDKIDFGLPRVGLDFVSKSDGSSFTLDDLREMLAKSLPNMFPVLPDSDSAPAPWVAPWELPPVPNELPQTDNEQ